jgi:hypothetical protein
MYKAELRQDGRLRGRGRSRQTKQNKRIFRFVRTPLDEFSVIEDPCAVLPDIGP